MNIMNMFNHTIIWTSKGHFNKETINAELRKGAGFVFYIGHGIPNGICPEGGSTDKTIHYYSRNIYGITNGFKLPIIFLTACSTSKARFFNSGDAVILFTAISDFNASIITTFQY